MSTDAATQQQRIARGLCPRCGQEAAPYYLCGKCRFTEKLRRIANRFSDKGLVDKRREGRSYTYQHRPGMPSIEDTGSVYREAQDGDGRLKPRLRHMPIDVEEQLVAIFVREGKPLTEEEIYAAWGRLRLREGRFSAATDMAALIRADRKRKRKYASKEHPHP